MLIKLQTVAVFLFFAIQLSGQDLMHVRIDSINSPYDEFNPVLSPDGNTLYVTRQGHAQNIAGVIDLGDIWYANKTEQGWTSLRHVGEVINHQGLNGVVGFSSDGTRMYLLNYFESDGDGGGSLRNGISVSRLENGEWTPPERLAIKYFQNRSSHLSATISRDEKVLIMSMESFTTEGNEDLYVSFKEESGEWTQPESLGLTINTYGQEWTPFLADDNRTLYFSSNTRAGYGGRDIYMTVREEGSWTQWSEPMNMGPSLNTEGVELGFFLPKGSLDAYLSSTQNSEGKGDIFTFAFRSTLPQPEPAEEIVSEEDETEPVVVVPADTMPTIQSTPPVEVETQPMVVMTFQVVDKESNMPVDASVKLKVGDQETSLQTSSLEGDKKFMKAFAEGSFVNVSIQAEGYLDYREEFTATAREPNEQDSTLRVLETFALTKNEIGKSVRIENVFFRRGSADFSQPEIAKKQIDKLIIMMQENPDMSIRLEGHTDDRGDDNLLKRLSESRVMTVKEYMISQGIDSDRIEVLGLGGTKPLTNNDTEAGREQNRRVEFVIIR